MSQDDAREPIGEDDIVLVRYNPRFVNAMKVHELDEELQVASPKNRVIFYAGEESVDISVVKMRNEAEKAVAHSADIDDENGTRRNPIYTWEPQKDISNYELALCMPVLTGYSIHNVGQKYYIEALLPKNASRHFREVK